MPTLIWWGRSDPDYSRNRIVRKYLRDLGCDIVDFRPGLSAIGDIEALFRRVPKAALVWLPCFRQRDLAAARRFARRRGIPLIADPLISAYDKQTGEREKFTPDSKAAQRLLAWERGLLQSADRVVADTEEHARYFHDTLGVAHERLYVVPVGAEEPLFVPETAPHRVSSPVEILFFGSFIHLQGPQYIIEAARLYQGPAVRWTLVGKGPLHAECVARAAGLDNVNFIDWVPYTKLAEAIQRADILLGIFGETTKAGRVIPNKVYQSLACGKPTITRSASAYPLALRQASESGLVWVMPADAQSLASAVAELASMPDRITVLGHAARATYERYFSGDKVRQALAGVLKGIG